MSVDQPDVSDEVYFVDPSIDPNIFWNITEFLADTGLGFATVKAIKELLLRFPAIEYAVGFDGVDDWISLDDLNIQQTGIDIKTKIWISEDNQDAYILDFANSDDDRVLGLAKSNSGDKWIQAIYRNSEGIQKKVITRLKSETWQHLRIWSDGDVFAVEVDGNQVASFPDIAMNKMTSTLYFGTDSHQRRFFEGMVKKFNIRLGSNQVFNLQVGKELKVEDQTASAKIVGLHELKKGRFKKEFRA